MEFSYPPQYSIFVPIVFIHFFKKVSDHIFSPIIERDLKENVV